MGKRFPNRTATAPKCQTIITVHVSWAEGLTFPNVKNDVGQKVVFLRRRRRPKAGDVFTRTRLVPTFGVSATLSTASRQAMFSGKAAEGPKGGGSGDWGVQGGENQFPKPFSLSTKFTRAKVEQGDALMPALFSVGQHSALVAMQEQLGPDERLFAFLDDIHVPSSPNRVVPIFNILRREFWTHARIQIHLRKTQIWR